MGDRYTLTINCPKCNHEHVDVWYAPTCGSTHFQCGCGLNIDLAEVTGISYEDCSNREEIAALVKAVSNREGEMMEQKEMDNRFTYHEPTAKQIERYNSLRSMAKAMAQHIIDLTPESREQSLAITKLEEAVMWANAAIARRG